DSVLGSHANTANRVAAPPVAVASRAVVAKAAAPPAPVPFAARQQVLEAHPGQPIARQEMQRLRPTNAATAQPLVKQAPPGKPATPTMGRPNRQPGNASATQPANPPGNQPSLPAPNNQPAPNYRPQPNQPQPNQPAPNYRPQPNQPQPNQPAPKYRPQPNQPTPTH